MEARSEIAVVDSYLVHPTLFPTFGMSGGGNKTAVDMEALPLPSCGWFWTALVARYTSLWTVGKGGSCIDRRPESGWRCDDENGVYFK